MPGQEIVSWLQLFLPVVYVFCFWSYMLFRDGFLWCFGGLLLIKHHRDDASDSLIAFSSN